MNDILVLLIPILSNFQYNDIAGLLQLLTVMHVNPAKLRADPCDEIDDKIDDKFDEVS